MGLVNIAAVTVTVLVVVFVSHEALRSNVGPLHAKADALLVQPAIATVRALCS